MENLGRVGENRPFSRLPRELRQAVAAYVAINAPRGRRKWVEDRFDLSPDQARSVCDGTASISTLERVFRHPNGRWALLIPIMGAVVGQELDDFIKDERKRHVEDAHRSRALGRDLRALAPSGGRAARELAAAPERSWKSRGG